MTALPVSVGGTCAFLWGTGSELDAQGGSAGAVNPGELPDHWKVGVDTGVNLGIAQDYVGDVGIAANPYVLAAEDFETGTVTIPTEEDRYATNVVVTSDEHYIGQYAGVHSCRFSHGGQGDTDSASR